MLRWYGRRERRRPMLVGCLLWLIALVVTLIVLSLLFGGFTKGTKVSGAGPTAQHASLLPR